MSLPKIVGEALKSDLSFGSNQSRRLSRNFFDLGESPLAPSQNAAPSGYLLLPILRLLLLTASLTFLANLVLLAGVEGAYHRKLSLSNSLQKVPLAPPRGLILDAQGNVLAGNAPSFDLYYYPSLCPESGCDLEFLKKYPLGSGDLQKTLSGVSENRVIRDLSQTQSLRLEKEIEGKNYLQIKTGQKRNYTGKGSFFHLLGYVSQVSEVDVKAQPGLSLSQKIGRVGLEKTYDVFLKGVEGGQIFEVDAQNRHFRQIREVPSQTGNNLILNIKNSLQEQATGALLSGIKNSKAASGAVVISEVKTGRILSLVSLPSLDANLFSSLLTAEKFSQLQQDPGKPFFNRAVLGNFPPGSVFKLVVASAALAEKVVGEKTLIEGPGSLSLGASTFRDWRPEGHGLINLVTALAQSCDTCFYKMGGGYQNFVGLGPQKIADWARLFGLGESLGIDLPAESTGLVPDPAWKQKTIGERWYVGNTYNFSIGQGDLLTTPLQINFMTAVVANGGRLFRPLLGQKIVDGQGFLVREFSPEVLRQDFIDPNVLAVVRAGLKKAVEPGGTAYPFFNAKYSLGGKTGTAETDKGKKTHAWFTAFAPFEDPEIAVTVFLEEGGEGSRDAAPVAKQILDYYFSQK